MVSGCPGTWCRGTAQVALLTVVLMLLVLAGGCNRSAAPLSEENNQTVKETRPLLYDRELSQVIVYYLSKDGAYLVPVTVAFNPTREVTKVAVEKLLAGPKDDNLRPVIPAGVKLREVYTINNKTVYIDFTRDFLQISDTEQAEIALKALVATVTELNREQSVQVLVEGKIVEEVAGVKINAPLQRAAYINSLLTEENEQGVTVYFSDATVLYFIPVAVALPAGSDENDLPRAAVEALLAGPPPDCGLVRTVWPDTRLLDFKLEDGLATVDLSKEAVGYGGGTTAEGALVNSLLYTLTGFDEINQVQLLIEGQKREYLPEGTEIDEPLSRPEQINLQPS
ncbi:MAG: hypothetical protein GX039_07275 [Clostridia bacterium]|nr:hypothetical protein [Clostridia bacterium]